MSVKPYGTLGAAATAPWPDGSSPRRGHKLPLNHRRIRAIDEEARRRGTSYGKLVAMLSKDEVQELYRRWDAEHDAFGRLKKNYKAKPRGRTAKSSVERYGEETIAKIREMNERGFSDNQIATELGRSDSQIFHIRHNLLKLPARKGTVMYHLSDRKDFQDEVRRLYNMGLNDAMIAERLGCSKTIVYNVRSYILDLPPNRVHRPHKKRNSKTR